MDLWDLKGVPSMALTGPRGNPTTPTRFIKMPSSVVGNTTAFGAVILGSSPSSAAKQNE